MCSIRCSTCTIKNKMFGLHNCVILFLLIYWFMLCHFMFKRKICKENEKQKESKCFYIWLQACFWRYGSYMIYLKGDGSHQTVMILCGCIWLSYIITLHPMRHLFFLQKFHTQHTYSWHSWYYCTGIMWFGHHKEYMWYYKLTKLS